MPVTPVGRLIVSVNGRRHCARTFTIDGPRGRLKETRAREAQQKKPMGYRVDRLARRCEVCSEKAAGGRAVLLRCGAELPP